MPAKFPTFLPVSSSGAPSPLRGRLNTPSEITERRGHETHLLARLKAAEGNDLYKGKRIGSLSAYMSDEQLEKHIRDIEDRMHASRPRPE